MVTSARGWIRESTRGMTRSTAQSRVTKGPNEGRALALIPIGVAVVLFALMIPRSAAPAEIPLPIIDETTLTQEESTDDALAARAKADGLPGDVRALGSAVRDFNTKQTANADDIAMSGSRQAITHELASLGSHGSDSLVILRAFQLSDFLSELHAYEHGAPASAELAAVGGPFVARMTDAGWIDGNQIAMDDHARRAAFKVAWNAIVGVEDAPPFSLTRDEARALYLFYLRHPHVGERDRQAIELSRKTTKTDAACVALRTREERALESWRLDKVEKLGKVDPNYPLAYARGVAHYRMGMYDAAMRDFEFWIDAHPDGAFTLRARNQLRGASELAER
jgi:TolA-binding protein